MRLSSVPLILERLSHLHPRLIDLSLGRIERLLVALGHPERSLPPVVHVAGTNGKGSVLAFLRAMLEADGRRVHVYTSPHLIRFHERIVVAGETIDDPTLAELLQACEDDNGGAPITFFEITTAAAFLAFARFPADACLLETGLGGRLDATNVIDRPAVTGLTPISLDHADFLGTDLGGIAWEKAGILKPGVPCVVGRQPDDASAVIETRAREIAAPLVRFGCDYRVLDGGPGLSVVVGHDRLDLPAPSLAGAHQRDNAAQAVALAQVLDAGPLPVSRAAMALGVQAAAWPARLQRLNAGRMAQALPAGWEVWLDGGHNPGAARVLAGHMATWQDRPLTLIVGMLSSKDADAFLKPLARLADRVLTLTIPDQPASLTAEALATLARHLGVAAESVPSLSEALVRAAPPGTAGGRVLICGSLYLAGAVLAMDRDEM